jgi:hypothetical protein
VTLGLNLSQLTSADQHIGTMRSVLRYFGVPTGTYAVSTPEPVVYHSAVRNMVSHRPVKVRAVVLGGQPGAPVTLFYRRHGKGAYYAVPMVKGVEKGAYSARIPREAVTPDGVDYYLKAGSHSTYDPALASTGQLAHAIGVALPEVADAQAVRAGAPVVDAAPPSTAGEAPGTLPTTGGNAGLAVLALVLVGVGIGGRRFLQH